MDAADTTPRRLAGSVSVMTVRRLFVAAANIAGTAVVARRIGVGDFGQLSAALAASALAASVSDFGFSLVLGRELGAQPSARGRLLRAGMEVQLIWTLLPTFAVVLLAVASRPTSTRGLALLVLAPAVAAGGLTGARQLYIATYRIRRLALIDVATNVLQLLLVVPVALIGGGAVGVAAVMSACSVANSLWLANDALRLAGSPRAARVDRSALFRQALPLGFASLMASVYFTVDLVLLAWLVSARQLGEYSAACKVLSILVLLPSLVMSVALPALGSTASRPDELRELAARLLHWLVALALPLCVGVAIFARTLARAAFGVDYTGAAPLIRILALAAAISLLSNLLGIVLVARSTVRPMLVQNGIALVLNVVGNVTLAPRFGVSASAWLTVATELVVCGSSFVVLQRRVALASSFGAAARPALAVCGLAATGLALADSPVVGIPASIATFAALVVVLRAWPAEFLPILSPSRRP